MHKMESLIHVHATLEPERQLIKQLIYKHPSPSEYEQLLRQVGELSFIQEEAFSHYRALELADLACAYGLAGTMPDRWDEVMGDEVYDAYRDLLEALDIAPNQQLSPALLAYIDQIPRRSSQDYQDMITRSRSDASAWLGNPLKDLTDEQVAQKSQNIFVEKVEAMLFAGTYADDLAAARQLAAVRGDFARIRELLA
jgi:hypothetical protein